MKEQAAPAPSTAPASELYCPRCWEELPQASTAVCPDPQCHHPRPAEGWTRLPQRFRNRFRLERRLGRGGMGVVFEAWDEQRQVRQALKTIQAKGGPAAVDAMKERFHNEAGTALFLSQRLDPAGHQLFVEVGLAEVHDPAYLVMELITWPTLDQLAAQYHAQRQAWSTWQLCRLGAALLRGLERMHEHSLVHRDLKPENLFVEELPAAPWYRVKIADLGLAVSATVDHPGSSCLAPPGRAGTVLYMSPEQEAGFPLGPASDLHAVGSILWELATGQVPYPAPDLHLGRSPGRVQALLTVPPRPSNLDERLYRLLADCLLHDPQARLQQAGDARTLRKKLDALATELEQERTQVLAQLDQQAKALQQRLTEWQQRLAQVAPLSRPLAELHDRVTEVRTALQRQVAGQILQVELKEVD